MTAFSVSLKIKDLKVVNLAYQRFDYYLRAEYQEEEPEITGCKDIVNEEAVFELKGGKNLTKLEIWDYNKQKQLVSIVIRKFDSKKGFQGKLQKINLLIQITKSVGPNSLNNTTLPLSQRQKKISLSTHSSLQEIATIASC